MALRIDHRSARLATPSAENIATVAKAIHDAHADFWGRSENVKPPAWDSLSEPAREFCMVAARAAYASIAMLSGAAVSNIPEPRAEPGSKEPGA